VHSVDLARTCDRPLSREKAFFSRVPEIHDLKLRFFPPDFFFAVSNGLLERLSLTTLFPSPENAVLLEKRPVLVATSLEGGSVFPDRFSPG